MSGSAPRKSFFVMLLVDHHAARDQVARIGLEGRARHGDGGGLGLGLLVHEGLAIVERRVDHQHGGILGGKVARGPALFFRLFPVAAVDRHLGQRDPGRQVVGILFHQPQVLAEGLARLAAFALHLGIGAAGFLVLAVQLEDIAELDKRPVHIAGLEQLEAGLIEPLGALFRAFAARQGDDGGKEKGGNQGGEMQAHESSDRDMENFDGVYPNSGTKAPEWGKNEASKRLCGRS